MEDCGKLLCNNMMSLGLCADNEIAQHSTETMLFKTYCYFIYLFNIIILALYLQIDRPIL